MTPAAAERQIEATRRTRELVLGRITTPPEGPTTDDLIEALAPWANPTAIRHTLRHLRREGLIAWHGWEYGWTFTATGSECTTCRLCGKLLTHVVTADADGWFADSESPTSDFVDCLPGADHEPERCDHRWNVGATVEDVRCDTCSVRYVDTLTA